MTNWESVSAATTTAINSVGSAVKENEVYMNSIEGKMNALSSAWEQLSYNLINSQLIKTFYDMATLLVKMLDTAIGRFALVAISATVVTGGISKFIVMLSQSSKLDFAKNIISGFVAIQTQIAATGLSVTTLKILLEGLSSVGWIGLILTALYGLYEGFKWLSESGERAKKRFEETTEALSSHNSEIQNTKTSLESITKELDGLYAKSELNLVDKERITDLETQKAILEAQLAILEEQTNNLKEQQKIAAVNNFNENYAKEKFHFEDESNFLAGFNNASTEEQKNYNIQEVVKAREYLLKQANDLMSLIGYLDKGTTEFDSAMELIRIALKNVNEDTYKQFAMRMAGIGDNEVTNKLFTLLRVGIKKGSISSENFTNDLLNMADALEPMGEDIPNLVSELEKYGITLEYVAKVMNVVSSSSNGTTEELTNADTIISEYSANIDELKSKLSTLNTAVEEFNSTGAITAETFSNLINNDLLNYLDYQNGQLVANTDALELLAEQERLSAAESLRNALTKDLEAVATGNMAEASLIAQNAIKKTDDSLVESVDYYQNATNAALNFAGALTAVASAQGVEVGSDTYQKMQSVVSQYNEYANLLRQGFSFTKTTSSGSGRSSSGSGRSSSGSGRSSTSKSKEWWETAMADLKTQYEGNSITINEYINGLENLLGKVQKGTEAYNKINKELTKQRLNKIDDDYKRGTIGAKEYVAQLKTLIALYKEGSDAWLDLADKIKKGLEAQAKEQKQNLSDAEKAAEGLIDDEIDNLEKLKDSQSEYYEKLIKDKEKANDETDKELKLAQLQEALANAKSNKTKRVWREGLGWRYEVDQKAIDDAQKALDDFNNEQELADLKAQKEEALNAIQEQIDGWKKYKESWQDVANDYEKQQQRMILAQTLGAETENQILQQRIEAIEKYRNAYLSMIEAMDWLENNSSVEVPSIVNPNGSVSLPGFSDGGVVDFTGLAMLHGSKSNPEYVLNSTQMGNLLRYMNRPSLASSKLATPNGQTIQNYNFGNIELPNVTNAKQFISEIKSLINITKNQ